MARMDEVSQKRLLIHVVEPCPKDRVEIATIATDLNFHFELYADHLEFLNYRPQSGIILLRDFAIDHDPAYLIDRFAQADIWLPVILMGENPEPGRVVDGIKAGALDYFSLPLSADRLSKKLARITQEVAGATVANRKMLEARKRISELTRREREVLQWLTLGNSSKAIARQLEISPRTVEVHRSNLLAKLGAQHAVEAIRICFDARYSRIV